MTEKAINWNVLGQLTDTTFGRSSTPRTTNYSDPEDRELERYGIDSMSKSSSFASHSLKVSFLHDNKMAMKYVTTVSLGFEKNYAKIEEKYDTEARTVMEEALKKIRTDYKLETGDAIKFKFEKLTSNIEYVGSIISNPKQVVYIRSLGIYAIEV